jgi:hypothetical protein
VGVMIFSLLNDSMSKFEFLLIIGRASFFFNSTTMRFRSHSETLSPSLYAICAMMFFIFGVTLVAMSTVFGFKLFRGKPWFLPVYMIRFVAF